MSDFEKRNKDTIDPISKDYIERTRKSVFGFFITRSRLTYILVAAIFIGGILALSEIPRESDPEVKIPVAVVTTPFLGASPSDVESLVTDKIENKLEELDDVALITSRSRNGLSSITIEFEAEADLEKSIRELKDKVLEVTGLPDDAEEPIVTEIRANDTPIITFSLAGDLPDAQLKKLGEAIQEELESIPGVSEVPLSGTRAREFLVVLNSGELARLNITPDQVISAISQANQDSPIGSITISDVDYNVRTSASIDAIDDLRTIAIASVDDRPIRLEDIARIEDGLAEKTTESRISLNGERPVNTVSLTLFKKTGGNILEIVDEAKERLETLQEEEVIPPQVSVEVSSDFSVFIRDDLNTLGRSGVQSVILIFILLWLALSGREALISLFAIPLSFFVAFIVLNETGNTLNSLTLFALVLSLGLLVDTFIVILEGIFHNVREGYSAMESSLLSVGHYSKPLFAGMFTTISAFVPMLLVSGILGEFLKFLPITITIILLAALFISFTIVPALAAIILKTTHNGNGTAELKESILEKYITNRLRKVYKKNVRVFLQNRRAKWKLTGSLTGLFVVGLGLVIGGFVPVTLFPEVDVDFVFVDLEMPIGTDLAITSEVAAEVEEFFLTKDYIESFVTAVGSSSGGFDIGASGQSNEHLANFNINLVDEEDRELKSFEITTDLREGLDEIIARGSITIEELVFGPPTGAPVEARITGDDLIELAAIADRLVTILKAEEGVINVTSNQDRSPADFTFSLKRDELSRIGLSPSDVSRFLRTSLFGVTATEISKTDEDIDVVVKFDKENLNTITDIENLTIPNARGEAIKVSRVADITLEPALATIRHRDFDRTLTVQADLEEGYVPTVVVPIIEEKLLATGIPSGYNVEFGGEVEDIEQSFAELWSALYVAVFLILVILVLQFDSFKKPFAILLVLPLTFIGVVIGLLLFGLPFSFSVFLGLVALSGIVVNDAIVLLDKVNRNVKEKGMTLVDALTDAGDTRLQPIILTSLTTIIGVVPLAFADEFWVGLSISIIFGLAFATILQLFVVPMVFLKLEGKKDKNKKRPSRSKRLFGKLLFWKRQQPQHV